jgi:hypothetical protein
MPLSPPCTRLELDMLADVLNALRAATIGGGSGRHGDRRH